jgi:multifunctional methyltransferase subunit TRM112
LIKNVLNRIQWTALKLAATNLQLTEISNIENVTEEMANDETFLKTIHHLLFQVHVMEGYLICPESHRRFPITEGMTL